MSVNIVKLSKFFEIEELIKVNGQSWPLAILETVVQHRLWFVGSAVKNDLDPRKQEQKYISYCCNDFTGFEQMVEASW